MAAQADHYALETAKKYVGVLRQNNIEFESAWLFGSSARGPLAEDSDIDIAVVMTGVETRFLKEVELMKYRRSIDLRIEPHILSPEELDSPFILDVRERGVRIA